MNKIDITSFIDAARRVVDNHYIGGGAYRRWLWQSPGGDRDLGVNEYGCADAANILYSIDEFSTPREERDARLSVLLSMQNKESGMFVEATHHTIHTTAHCCGAIELFDTRPLYPVRELEPYLSSRSELWSFLDGLDWRNPWPQSHRGAGVYAALVNSGEATADFRRNYFDWLYENADPVTGFWKKGEANLAEISGREDIRDRAPLFMYMAGGFHFLFNIESAHMPIPYPEAVIDSCLTIIGDKQGCRDSFLYRLGFLELDWLYCINRARRQAPTYRSDEVQAAIEKFAKIHTEYLLSVDYERDERMNDLHMLFGTVCAMAELQIALPGMIITERPLRQILDRRPFV
ncbi:MAG: hypothetical protein IJY69_01545 [Clostridia bacterium]|nr:hypothetical protein [Clostridia bacterium]